MSFTLGTLKLLPLTLAPSPTDSAFLLKRTTTIGIISKRQLKQHPQTSLEQMHIESNIHGSQIKTLEIIEHCHTAKLEGDLAKYKWCSHVRYESIHAGWQKFWEDDIRKLEDTTFWKDLKQVHKTLHQARAGPNHRTHLIKDAQGNDLASDQDSMKHWSEHFHDLLNGPYPPEDPDEPPSKAATSEKDQRPKSILSQQ